MKKSIIYNTLFFVCCCQLAIGQTTWTPVSPDFFPTNASGQIHGISRVSQVKFHPSNASKMYAVSSRGGLFITSNAGTTWSLAAGCDLLPNMRLNSVCVDHTNDQIIYLGTGDANYYYTGSGVYKSTDGGNTFTSSGLGGRLIVEILMNPSNNQMLIAATDAGIYKSTNGGSSWTLKSAGSLACRDMVFKAKSGTQTIFATTYSELYRSVDMGETWTQITSGIYFPVGSSTGGGCRVAVTPADSQVVYFSMIANNGTIFKSTNGGTSFVNMKDSVMPNLTAYDNTASSTGQGDYNCMFNADPVNANTLYFGSHNFWKSTNGGTSWTKMTSWWAELHTDMHWVKVNPYNTSQIWTANDGGVWMSTNGGTNWTPKSDGIYGYEIYHGSCSPTRRDMFSIGTQDNGELYHSSGTWFTNRGGDWGSVCAFDYRSNSSMVYYLGNNERRLVTGGDQTYGLPVTYLQDIAFHRGYTNLAFAANQEVYRTTNLQNTTPTWTQITSINKTIKAVHVNLADSNRLYIITNDANIYVSTNALSATPTFTNYVLPNSTSNVASITSIKTSPNTLYAVMNTRVYRSTDNGATWTNVSANLPSTNWVKILPDEYFSANEMVFVAGNNTVYYKKASQTNWTLFANGLPARTTINDFSVYDDGTNQSALRVSEYGRGMWEVPMTSLRTITAAFSANQVYPCTGGTVQFNDESTGNITSWTWTFPGGTPSSSTLQNPTVVYNTPGIYNVTLTVSDGISPNTLTKTNYINTNGSGLPLSEGFESAAFPPTGFTNVDAGNNGVTWAHSTAAGGFGNSSNSIWFDNFAINVNGNYDEMRTSRYDMVGLSTAQLTFDVAYQPYNTTNYTDTLQVLISTNCGASYSSVYLKGGATLSTVAGTNTSAFVPTAAQWRTETINLGAYLAGSIIVSFKNLGHYGNNLYIDNINITGTVTANAGADKIYCVGTPVAIGNAPVNGLSYSWSPVAGLSSASSSNPLASPTVNTQYILTVTKTGSSISKNDTMMVTVDSVPFTALVTHVNCNGANNGAVDLSTSSGFFPYAYNWSTGASSQDLSSLGPGIYSVTVTDNASCARNVSYTITQPTALNSSVSATESNCFNNGTASVQVSGGITPYSYNWSGGGNTSTITNLAPGIYAVTVTDANNCTATGVANVTAKPLPVINSFTATASPACTTSPVELNVQVQSGAPAVSTFVSGTLNVTIPDNNATGISNTININSPTILSAASELTVTINFGTGSTAPNREHTLLGNLKATLTTPGGNTVIFDRPGVPANGVTGSGADMNGSYSFSVSAASLLPQTTNAVGLVVGGNVVNGTYKPSDSSNPDAAHSWSGLSFPFGMNGNWTLTIADLAAASVGDLVSWSVSINVPSFGQTFSGPGVVGITNCQNSDCSNATATVTSVPAGNNMYTVVTTAPDGCTVTASSSITINSAPSQPGSISGDTVPCVDDTLTYSINAVANATNYLWTLPGSWSIINGAGSTVIEAKVANTSGNVTVSASNLCGTGPLRSLTVNPNVCLLTVNIKAYIQGIYMNGGNLQPVFHNALSDTSLTKSDSILVQLRDPNNTSSIVYNIATTINTSGIITLALPGALNGGSYYIVLFHRSSIETWSKLPVTVANNTYYNFTAP